MNLSKVRTEKYEKKFPLFSLSGGSTKPAQILNRIHFRPLLHIEIYRSEKMNSMKMPSFAKAS